MAEKAIVSAQDIQALLRIVRKNWWITVVLVGLCFLAGYLYSYKLTNIYAAQCQILIKSNDEYNSSSLISDNSFYGNTYKTYVDNSNEKRVIMSYDMIQNALDRLDFYVSYYLVGRLRTEEVFSGVPFHVKVNLMNKELVGQNISFRILSNDDFEISYTRKDAIRKVKGRYNQPLTNIDMDIVVTKNPRFSPAQLKNLASIEYIFVYQDRAAVVSRVQAALRVDNPDYTNILQLSLTDVVPERAAMFLDTLAQVYIESTLQSNYEINKNTLYFIDKQKDEVTRILNAIEDTLTDYREKNKILNLSQQGEQYFEQYISFDNTKRSLQLQLGALEDLERYIIEDKDPKFLPPSMYVLSNDLFLQKSTEELYKMQLTRNENLSLATSKNYIMRQLDQRIDSVKADLLTYIGNAKNATVDRMNLVQTQIDTSIQEITGIPHKERGLNNIRRMQKVNEDMYMFLLQKHANTLIARASILPQTKVIERARVTGIVSPNRPKIYYISIGIAVLLSLVIIVVRVMFYTRVESYEELKAITNLPIVGEIVYSKLLNELKIVVEHEPKSALAESFRTIRTNLQYMLPEHQRGMIVITSNNPGEGKTFCSLNLAAILAKSDKRVILLELDLHKPRVQKGLGMEATSGISTYVIGKSTVEEIIHLTTIDNLSVILSGPLPPNPSEIIVSRKIRELLEYCREHYDIVIVDTPPIGLISDALVLMKLSDVNLFVLNTRLAYRSSVNNAQEIAEMNKLTNFAFILNGVKRKRSRYYYNRYGYGYSYGTYGSGYGGYGSYGSYGYGDQPRKKRDK